VVLLPDVQIRSRGKAREARDHSRRQSDAAAPPPRSQRAVDDKLFAVYKLSQNGQPECASTSAEPQPQSIYITEEDGLRRGVAYTQVVLVQTGTFATLAFSFKDGKGKDLLPTRQVRLATSEVDTISAPRCKRGGLRVGRVGPTVEVWDCLLGCDPDVLWHVAHFPPPYALFTQGLSQQTVSSRGRLQCTAGRSAHFPPSPVPAARD